MSLLAIRHRVRRRKINHFGKTAEHRRVAKDSRVFVRLQLPDLGDDLLQNNHSVVERYAPRGQPVRNYCLRQVRKSRNTKAAVEGKTFQ